MANRAGTGPPHALGEYLIGYKRGGRKDLSLAIFWRKCNIWADKYSMNIEAWMPPSSNGVRSDDRRTLANLLSPLSTAEGRGELEEFRIAYEARFGETDLTRRWTSTWPPEDQAWLLEHHPKRYWDGLPPFVKAYAKEKMAAARRAGKLDDMPPNLLRLYLTGNMEVTDGPSR
jgi:hypothetical protein